MIITTLLLMITLIVLFVGLSFLAIGGSIATLLFSDVIVAMGIVWVVFFRKKKAKKSKSKQTFGFLYFSRVNYAAFYERSDMHMKLTKLDLLAAGLSLAGLVITLVSRQVDNKQTEQIVDERIKEALKKEKQVYI